MYQVLAMLDMYVYNKKSLVNDSIFKSENVENINIMTRFKSENKSRRIGATEKFGSSLHILIEAQPWQKMPVRPWQIFNYDVLSIEAVNSSSLPDLAYTFVAIKGVVASWMLQMSAHLYLRIHA